MTYLETITLLKLCFTELEATGTFVRGRRQDASQKSVNANGPLCLLMPFKETKNYRTGDIKRQITMFFLSQDSVDSSPDQRDAIISTMNILQDAYMSKLIAKLGTVGTYFGKAELGAEVFATPEQMIYAGSVSGYGVQFNLTSKMACS